MKRIKRNSKKISRLILFLIALLLMGYSGYQIFDYFYTSDKNAVVIDELIHIKEELKKPDKMDILDQEMKKINDDYIGWLEIYDTPINFPVVQGFDHEYYLFHDFYKNWSVYGSIYVSAGFKPDDQVVLIYGHNMTDGQMFTPLLEFENQAYYDSHKRLMFNSREYLIVSSYIINIESTEYQYWNCELSLEDQLAGIEMLKNNSIIESENEQLTDDYVILSTCIQGKEELRFLVLAQSID